MSLKWVTANGSNNRCTARLSEANATINCSVDASAPFGIVDSGSKVKLSSNQRRCATAKRHPECEAARDLDEGGEHEDRDVERHSSNRPLMKF